MAGEPDWFDLTTLEAIEIETATGQEIPSNIIDYGENFYLKATFQGDPAQGQWVNMKGAPVQYQVTFYAEGMGPGVPDQNLGQSPWTDLTSDVETVNSQINNITTEGLYRCGCYVTFRHQNGSRYYGVLGYNEDCVIQISISEEIG